MSAMARTPTDPTPAVQIDFANGLLGLAMMESDLGHKVRSVARFAKIKRAGHWTILNNLSLFSGVGGLIQADLLGHERSFFSPANLEHWIRIAIEMESRADLISGLPGWAGILSRLSERASHEICKVRWRERIESMIDNKIKFENEADLGLAHGWAGIDISLAEFSSSGGLTRIPALRVLDKAFNHFEAISGPLISKSKSWYWPSSAHRENGLWSSKTSARERQAWCYGSAGVQVARFKVGVAMDRPDLYESAIQNFLLFAQADQEELLIVDPFICHGASGIALAARFFWNVTADVKAKKAWIRWKKIAEKMFEDLSQTSAAGLGILNGRDGYFYARDLPLENRRGQGPEVLRFLQLSAIDVR